MNWHVFVVVVSTCFNVSFSLVLLAPLAEVVFSLCRFGIFSCSICPLIQEWDANLVFEWTITSWWQRKFEWRFRHIAFSVLVLAGKNKDKGKDREIAWYEILLLSSLMIWDTLTLVWLVCRGILREEENWVFRDTLWKMHSRRWGRVRYFSVLPCHGGQRLTYIWISQ